MARMHSSIGGGGSGGGTETRAGSATIAISDQFTDVLFSSSFPDTSYGLVTSITNTVDADPIWIQIVSTVKTTTGFRAYFNAPADSANYLLEYVALGNV